MVHQERHAILQGEIRALQEGGKADGRWRDFETGVELRQDAADALNQVGALVFHDQPLAEKIPQSTVLDW
jgi:hypothetical protein